MSDQDEETNENPALEPAETAEVVKPVSPAGGPAVISLTASGNLSGVSLIFKGSKDADEPKAGAQASASEDGAKPDEGKPKEVGQPKEGEKKNEEEKKGQGGDEKKADAKKKPGLLKRPGVMGIIILVVIIAVIAIVLFWRHSRAYQATDDAFIDVVSEQVSPQISGRVVQVLVNDNQTVTAGQVLVKLDPADDQVRLDQARASRAQAEAQLKQAEAQVTVSRAQVEEAKAKLASANADRVNATNQLNRLQKLKTVNSGAVSPQQLDSAQAAKTSADAGLDSARKAVAAAEAQVGYAHSLEIAAQAGIGSADASIRQAELTLSYTEVKARVDGRVASKTVSEGNIVAAGTPLMAVVPKSVYVTANFKETQLAKMRPGQEVDITVDAYPDMKLTGKVDSVQAASGQAFSLLPAQNATGNWVKVVQRIPVKVVFDHTPDDPARPLGPGMSVEVSVRER